MTVNDLFFDKNLEHAIAKALPTIAKEAGLITLKYYKNLSETQTKDDHSLLTIADIEANDHIEASLKKSFPSIPIISEETVDKNNLHDHDLYFLIDPLDGTQEFACERDAFTINIALIYKHKPLLGAVYAPAYQEMFWTDSRKTAFHQQDNASPQRLTVRPPNFKEGLVVAASFSHIDNASEVYLKKLPLKKLVHFGSSLKICRVAQGTIDLYPRLGPTRIWDTGAAHAVLNAAGGTLKTFENQDLTYNPLQLKNPTFYAAAETLPDEYLL